MLTKVNTTVNWNTEGTKQCSKFSGVPISKHWSPIHKRLYHRSRVLSQVALFIITYWYKQHAETVKLLILDDAYGHIQDAPLASKDYLILGDLISQQQCLHCSQKWKIHELIPTVPICGCQLIQVSGRSQTLGCSNYGDEDLLTLTEPGKELSLVLQLKTWANVRVCLSWSFTV